MSSIYFKYLRETHTRESFTLFSLTSFYLSALYDKFHIVITNHVAIKYLTCYIGVIKASSSLKTVPPNTAGWENVAIPKQTNNVKGYKMIQEINASTVEYVLTGAGAGVKLKKKVLTEFKNSNSNYCYRVNRDTLIPCGKKTVRPNKYTGEEAFYQLVYNVSEDKYCELGMPLDGSESILSMTRVY